MEAIIRKTEARDIPALVEIFAEARKTIAALGIDQWQNGYPNAAVVAEDIERSQSFVVETGGRVIATFAMLTNGEPTYDTIFDGQWETGDHADYIALHRVAILVACRGQGISTKIIDHAVACARALERRSLRIDTHEGNVVMRKMLEHHGFVHCGTIHLADGAPRVAYEYVLSKQKTKAERENIMLTWNTEKETLLKKIDAAIEAYEPTLVADIIRLVNIKSVKGDPLPGTPFGAGPRAVQDAITEMAGDINLIPTDYGCGVISLARKAGKPDLGIWLHADVVPEGTGWLFEPYNAVEYKGCVVGRGATDNKGQMAAILGVLRIFHRMGIELSYNPAMYVGSNEETGMKDMIGVEGNTEAKGFLNVAEPPKMSLVPDGGFPVGYGGKGGCTLALVSEKPLTSCRLIAGHSDAPGFAYAYFDRADLPTLSEDCKVTAENGKTTVETFSPPRHGASPDPNGNMITTIAKALLDASLVSDEERGILEFFREVSTDIYGGCLGVKTHHEVLGDLTVFASSIHEHDGHPALRINIRYPLGITYEQILARIEQAIKPRGFRVEPFARSVDPYLMDKNGEMVRLLCDIANSVTGENKEPFTMSGGTYAHRLPNAYVFGTDGGVPPADYPKGRGGAHGLDEVVSIERMKRAMRIYARTLLSLENIL